MTKIRPLSPKLAEKANELFQENDVQINTTLEQIKQWLSLQPHLKVRTDDQWLIAFARGCKYSLERIQKKLEGYYSLRTEYPDVFRRHKDPKDPVLDYFINTGSFLAYNSKEDPTKPTIIIARAEYNSSKYSLDEALRYAAMVVDISLYDNDNMSVNGVIEILDMEKVPLSLVAQVTFGFIRKVLRWMQEGLPVSFKGVYFINPPRGFKTIFEILKLFANEKLKKRFFVYSSIKDLYEYIPKTDLPNEYGGSVGNFEELKALWVKKFEKYSNWLIEDEEFYADDSLRIKSENNNSCSVM